ncbi:MAG: type VI secretion system membrane subunit TssM [Candidatus Mucispirillum faecigallinarum]|nr:type VI secretion system membrane subunit TssM [Candidatus Mucispirillum faecigallinarum]
MGAIIGIIKKIGKFLISKPFLIGFAVLLLILLCVLFWVYSPLIAFNDIHIFGNPFVRGFILLIIWLSILLIFAFKKTKDVLHFFKNENRSKLKDIKHDAKGHTKKTRRNFLLSLKEARHVWKNTLKFHNIPLVMVVGNEGAGKSSFINYSEIEFPVTDVLGSYKKHHKSTRNFSLYVSKNGAIVDTEGNFFALEKLFTPEHTDEMPEDDIDKHKVFITKKIVWKSFLKMLNKFHFYKKLNGIVLVVDLPKMIFGSEEELKSSIAYMVQRVSECENYLNLQLPVYIVFKKIDLLEGMPSFLKVYNEKISKQALGLTFGKHQKVSEDYLKSKFSEMINSFKFALMNKNYQTASVEDKKKAYLYLAQLETLCYVISGIVGKLIYENSNKNKSFIRGVYFTSAYQENIPVNILFDKLANEYSFDAPVVQHQKKTVKNSFFVYSLLKDIIFKDKGLGSPIFGSNWKKASLIIAGVVVFSITYSISGYYVDARKSEIERLENSLRDVKIVIDEMDKNYNTADIAEKSVYINRLRNILAEYPQLFGDESIFDGLSLNLTYRGLRPAKILYIDKIEDILSLTLVKEMEDNLLTEKQTDKLVRALYMYKALFEREYLDKSLLKLWVKDNYELYKGYDISEKTLYTYIDDLPFDSTFPDIKISEMVLNEAVKKLNNATRSERLYALLSFRANSIDGEGFYSIKEDAGSGFDDVFDVSNNFYLIPKTFTLKGVEKLFSNITTYIEDLDKIDMWALNIKEDEREEQDNVALSVGIINLYLQEYQQKWQSVLENLKPKRFNGNDSGLSILAALSKPSNPVKGIIEVVSNNTDLINSSLLKHASNLGLPTSKIRSNFSILSDAFMPYHEIARQDSFFNQGLEAVSDKAGVQAGDKQVKIMDKMSIDAQNVYKKIVDYVSGNAPSKDKITYALKPVEIADDPFFIINKDASELPIEIGNYYKVIASDAWSLIEFHAGIELNKAWQNEMYAQFMNQIASYYPINTNGKESLKFDSFRSFFGKQGVWNKFFTQYLDLILVKRWDVYDINPTYSSKINFSNDFLSTVYKLATITNGVLDLNDNLDVEFTITTVALSGDYGSIELSYDNNVMVYDQTFPSSLKIVGDNFKENTKLKLVIKDYNGAVKETREYTGEWAWLQFIQSGRNICNGVYRITFNGNDKLYFDWKVDGGNTSLDRVLNSLPNLTIPQNILKR